MILRPVCDKLFNCLILFATDGILQDQLTVITESAQAARDNQKSSCFVCDKLIPKDSSKRRLHMGKHIIKASRNVTETPTLANAVGFAQIKLSHTMLT
jgi:hypothetical protein